MAATGVAIGVAIAFVVILVATRNLIVTALCVVTISCSLVCVMGAIVAGGWQLGSVRNTPLCRCLASKKALVPLHHFGSA
eukprot:6213552-Pleurochrysis_carterae.AAC.1